jgi:hypothetical protein
MRDVYVIGLFRLEHVISLLKAGCVGEALFLLPWALIMRALLSAVISVDLRCYLLELALAFLYQFYVPTTKYPRPRPEQGKHGIEVIPLKRITAIRAMNTVLGFIFALRNLKFDIPLDRMSTHPLENFFGLLRRLLHDSNDFDALLRATAKNAVVNEVYHELKHPFDICGRANTAGVVSRRKGGQTLNAVCGVSEFFGNLMDTVHTYVRAGYPPCKDWFEFSGLSDALHDWLVDCERISSTRAIEQGADVTVRRRSNRNIMGNVMPTDLDTKKHQTEEVEDGMTEDA